MALILIHPISHVAQLTMKIIYRNLQEVTNLQKSPKLIQLYNQSQQYQQLTLGPDSLLTLWCSSDFGNKKHNIFHHQQRPRMVGWPNVFAIITFTWYTYIQSYKHKHAYLHIQKGKQILIGTLILVQIRIMSELSLLFLEHFSGGGAI